MAHDEPRILVYDHLPPEEMAMLQALYSRSASSAREHIERVKKSGSGKFMETYYVGYSHKSIGDCGTTTLFFEGVSELAAKAIQDWPLYNGQQTSTRYIDFARQPLRDPLETELSRRILDTWMQFYIESQEPLREWLSSQFPPREGEKQATYDKAIQARSFDILRAFLPAAVTTQLSWHTNLRQARDKLQILRHHPLPEVRSLAQQALLSLREKYPHSFPDKEYAEQEGYLAKWVPEHSYLVPDTSRDFQFSSDIKADALRPYAELLAKRPARSELPAFLGELGQLHITFSLDYGSFRDIQRHRNTITRMPLLTTTQGFEQWYIDNLPPELVKKATDLIDKQTERLSKLDCAPELAQYYTALGFRTRCRISCGLPEAVYITELRSGATVHPTLRRIAHQLDEALRGQFPELVLHSDLSADAFSYKRGKEDITAREV